MPAPELDALRRENNAQTYRAQPTRRRGQSPKHIAASKVCVVVRPRRRNIFNEITNANWSDASDK